MLDQRHPADHAFSCNPIEPVEVLVTEASVPAPRRLAGVCRQAHWPDELQVDDAEVIARARHPGKDAALAFVHRHVSIFNERRAADFVQLTDGDNVALQLRDPIHIG